MIAPCIIFNNPIIIGGGYRRCLDLIVGSIIFQIDFAIIQNNSLYKTLQKFFDRINFIIMLGTLIFSFILIDTRHIFTKLI